MSSKHEIIKNYFEPIVTELAGTVLHFNFSPEAADDISIITRYSDKRIREYINGDMEKEYGFAIVVVKNYSTEADDINVEAMEFAEGFMEWLEEQDRKKDFPVFGEDIEVLSMENLQNMPNLAAINEEEGLARYQLQGRIRYLEHSKENW